jgi:hypothetical protein
MGAAFVVECGYFLVMPLESAVGRELNDIR